MTSPQHVAYRRRQDRSSLPVAALRGGGPRVQRERLARVALPGQEGVPQAIEPSPDRRRAGPGQVRQPAQIPGQGRRGGILGVAGLDQQLYFPAQAGQAVGEPAHRGPAGALAREVGRRPGEKSLQGARHDEPALEQAPQRGTGALRPQSGEEHGDAGVLPGQPRGNNQGAVDGLVGESGDLGLVRDPETGVEVRLQRKLPEQGQAEGVDGADRDLSQPVAQLAPAHAARRRLGSLTAQRADDSGAHLGRRLPGERDRQDVGRRDSRLQEPQIPLDQHGRLAGTGRGFQDHVVGRVRGELARGAVGKRVRHSPT